MEIHINLDGGEVPSKLVPEGRADLLVNTQDPPEVTLMAGGMASGAHSVIIAAKIQGSDKIAVIQMSAKHLLLASAAIRGRLVQQGVITQAVNPGIAFGPYVHPETQQKVVHFSSEVPLESWYYTLDHAKKWWRLLRDFCDRLERGT